MSKIAVIGSGFSGLSAAAYLSQAGHQVHVYEKNSTPGGRARQFTTESGYVFDMGPSWYWMPDVIANFFRDFGHSVSDFYRLTLLDPSFEVVFAGRHTIQIPENFSALCTLFESIEKGSARQLEKFMAQAQYKYETGMQNLAHMPGLTLKEFAIPALLRGLLRLQVFTSFSSHVRKYFTHPRLIALMEFPVLFLGAMPQDTPALYSLMNYAGLRLGTWYPIGGFGVVVDGIVRIARANGCTFHYNAPVDRILLKGDQARGLQVAGQEIPFDAVLATADYHHVESRLLPATHRNYTEAYWAKKTLAPSSLIFYIGLRTKVPTLQHHTLFFEEDLYQHSVEIYKDPQWPTRPLFYVCCPSRTDRTVAPEGHENLFLLMPLAPGLEDSETRREKYYTLMMDRLHRHLGQDIRPHVDYKRSYCLSDFTLDYNSYKGNAYGLANTLRQTAILKPKIKNKKIGNLFYAGQLTVPGPGVPPALISGKIAAQLLIKHLNPLV